MKQDNQQGTFRTFNGIYAYGEADNGIVYNSQPKAKKKPSRRTPSHGGAYSSLMEG